MAEQHAPQVRLDRVALTDMHLRTLEIALYQAADLVDRLRPQLGVYTKRIVNEEVPNARSL